MIANGRNFTESESNISTQGHWAEHLVGILMLDGLGLDPSLDQILSTIDPALAKGGFPRLDLSEDQLEMIRRRRTELVSEWQALPNDHVMRLDFPG